MKRNGRAPSGAQRWRCRSCGASATHSNDVAARELAAFVGWLLSRGTQADMPGRGRTFRRRAALFWPIWPMPEVVDEAFRVVYVDGIWIARAETTAAWRSLLSRIAPPDMVVTDGGSGFASAVAAEWPRTRVQRCVFHAFCQVKRHTTSRPKLQAGVEPYALARELLHVETLQQADWWVERFMQWCEFWSDFLERKSLVEGRMAYTHRRLREARSGLVRLVNAGTLFTYLDPALCAEGPMPATNNRIEGGRELPAPRGPEEPPRPHEAQARQGRVLVVLPACRMPEDDGGHAARDAHRRRRRPAEGAIRHEGRGRLPSREMGRGPRVGGAPPQDEIPVPKRMNNRPRHTFCPIGLRATPFGRSRMSCSIRCLTLVIPCCCAGATCMLCALCACSAGERGRRASFCFTAYRYRAKW